LSELNCKNVFVCWTINKNRGGGKGAFPVPFKILLRIIKNILRAPIPLPSLIYRNLKNYQENYLLYLELKLLCYSTVY
jgi:hypothetical protein